MNSSQNLEILLKPITALKYPKSITSSNLQANSILERINWTIDNIIRIFKVQDITLMTRTPEMES